MQRLTTTPLQRLYASTARANPIIVIADSPDFTAEGPLVRFHCSFVNRCPARERIAGRRYPACDMNSPSSDSGAAPARPSSCTWLRRIPRRRRNNKVFASAAVRPTASGRHAQAKPSTATRPTPLASPKKPFEVALCVNRWPGPCKVACSIFGPQYVRVNSAEVPFHRYARTGRTRTLNECPLNECPLEECPCRGVPLSRNVCMRANVCMPGGHEASTPSHI